MFTKVFILIIFIAVMIGVGIYSHRRIKNMQDFFLGGRNMGAWISAFAYGTSYFSAVIFIGYAGKIGWGFGISSTWIGIANAILGCMLAWMIFALRTRKITRKLDIHTMPEFFEVRYDSRIMKIVAALIIFVFLVPYTASVYKGLGYLFESSFNISFNWVIMGMALLTAVYLLLGGYVATAINDLIQGVIMIGGVILMVYLVVNNSAVGGLSNGIAKLKEINPSLVSVTSGNPWALFSLIFMTSVGAWGLPQMIHKFYAIKDEKAIKRGTVISTIFSLIIGGGAYFVGSFGRLFLDNQVPIDSITGADNFDMIVPKMLEISLPDMLLGIIIILILSASMSTLSSLVLVSSSTLSIDLIKGFINPKMDAKKSVLVMRVFCGIFVILSVIIAISQPATIVTLMSLSWGVISGMFLAPYLYGIWWKGTTKAGAWAGFIVGGAVMIIGMLTNGFGLAAVEGTSFIKMILVPKDTINVPGLATVAIILPILVVPLVSLATKKYSDVHLERVFSFKPQTTEKESG